MKATQPRSNKSIRRTFYVVAFILGAAVVVAVVAFLLHVGSSGRDFGPHLTALAILLLTAAAAFRYFRQWPWLSLIAGLAIAEFLALLIIGFFSGSTGLDLFSPFNLKWLSFVSLFLGLPWLTGAAIGEVIYRIKRRRDGANTLLVAATPQHMNTTPIEGGLYCTIDSDGTYSVIKILKVDVEGVHVRQYSNSFTKRPTSLDPATLFMAGMQRDPGVKLGIGHTPVSHRSFASWNALFLQGQRTLPEELDGYEYWKEENGGYF